jgi:hypothetical protein
MDNYNNRMYQDKYIRNLIGKIAFGIIVFIVSLMWVIVARSTMKWSYKSGY